MTEHSSLHPNDEIEMFDKEALCSSSESTPSQVRRRISDVKQTKEKYVNRAKVTISAGKISTSLFSNHTSLSLFSKYGCPGLRYILSST